MATPMWIRTMLDRRGIPYREFHHADAFTAQEVAKREHISGNRVAKVVAAMVDGRPVALVLPASRHVDLERVREVFAAREVRFASEAEMARVFTDCELGATPPLRHWQDVPVLMDPSLKVEGNILFQAGTHADAILVNFRDWFDLVNPQVAAFAELAEAAHA